MQKGRKLMSEKIMKDWISRSNIWLIRIPEIKMQGNETEAIFLKLIAENLSELMKDINP